MEPLILTKNLMVGYDKKAVAGPLNFQILPGDYLCIVGENGSGKSTLMKTLLSLTPAVSGEVVFGSVLQKNGIGYLPQQTQVQKDFPASVYEVVLSGCQGKAKLFYRKEHKLLAEQNMERIGITDLQKKCYRELSGGQQQRVLLARALCATDQILLLDEPVTGLDPKVTEQMYELIASLNKEGTAIIEITHDVTVALSYAKTVLHIGNHKQDYFGETAGYLGKEMKVS